MVKCPRCEFPVDETTRTTCPLCFTPLPASAGEGEIPLTPQSAAAPEQSVVAQPPVVPVMPPPAVPTMTPPVVPMPPQQAMPPPQVPQGYAPPPPQAQQMPGMYQAQNQQQGGGMPQAAPQPPQQPQYTPGSAPRPGVRVSLTGEVIDDSMNTAPPPSYVGGAIPPPRPAGSAGISVGTASRARRGSRCQQRQYDCCHHSQFNVGDWTEFRRLVVHVAPHQSQRSGDKIPHRSPKARLENDVFSDGFL